MIELSQQITQMSTERQERQRRESEMFQQRSLWSLNPAAPEQDRFANKKFVEIILLERSSILLP